VSVLEVAARFAPKFLSSHILPVLGEGTVLYLNPLKFIVPLVESEGSEGSEGSQVLTLMLMEPITNLVPLSAQSALACQLRQS
jgi:hypothetical protein